MPYAIRPEPECHVPECHVPDSHCQSAMCQIALSHIAKCQSATWQSALRQSVMCQSANCQSAMCHLCECHLPERLGIAPLHPNVCCSRALANCSVFAALTTRSGVIRSVTAVGAVPVTSLASSHCCDNASGAERQPLAGSASTTVPAPLPAFVTCIGPMASSRAAAAGSSLETPWGRRPPGAHSAGGAENVGKPLGAQTPGSALSRGC